MLFEKVRKLMKLQSLMSMETFSWSDILLSCLCSKLRSGKATVLLCSPPAGAWEVSSTCTAFPSGQWHSKTKGGTSSLSLSVIKDHPFLLVNAFFLLDLIIKNLIYFPCWRCLHIYCSQISSNRSIMCMITWLLAFLKAIFVR